MEEAKAGNWYELILKLALRDLLINAVLLFTWWYYVDLSSISNKMRAFRYDT